jgi:D-glycero-D-manno-heptose 1,7-bisphosphate phosphatase
MAATRPTIHQPASGPVEFSRIEAVFLDRDGVINVNRPDHVKSWDEFQFIGGACEAIARLTCAGLRVFVVSNQAIVNRGILPAADVERINHTMIGEIERHGGRIEAIAYCPHRPDEACGCRKPAPGLLFELARTHGIELDRAVVIGDALTDLQAGRAAGCGVILVLSGRGQQQLAQAAISGWTDLLVVSDLAAVTGLLVANREETRPDLNPVQV